MLEAQPKRPSTDLRRPGGPSPGSAPALLAHASTDALAALLVASPGSGPPGSPNLSSRFSAAPLGLQAADCGVQSRKRGGLIAPLEDDAVERVEHRLADLVPLWDQGKQLGVLQLVGVDLHHRVARQR